MPTPYDAPRYGSDVMVDAMRAMGFPYLSLNPGSSFRGLHDSLVNYGGDEMAIIECPHEKIAVAVAHGYAKTTGSPMGVVLHNVVGLLQGTMGIYYAYIDRAPVLVFGGAGPAGLRPTPAEHRLDPRRQRPGKRRAGIHQVGLRAALDGVRPRGGGARIPDCGERAGRPGLRRPGRRTAGASS